jgi:hypothetical protein
LKWKVSKICVPYFVDWPQAYGYKVATKAEPGVWMTTRQLAK